MNDQGVAGQKRAWVVLFSAFPMMIVWLVVFRFSFHTGAAHARTGAESVIPILCTVAVCCAAVAAFLVYLYLQPKDLGGGQFDVPSMEFFRVRSTMALTFAEFPVMIGFVLTMITSASVLIAGVLALLTLIVDFGVILPAGLRYWKLMERK